MSATGAGQKRSPYKFLDYYEVADRPIFFGRERETQTLLSDVVATRIVVLFARTGSGKTSLINAGVRPRLHELDYETFYIRVEEGNPAASVLSALRNRELLTDDPAEQAVAPALRSAAKRLGQPIVVFFDQFEEFFIYLRDPADEQRARDFIANVAELYRDRESGVHTVFSMREEYFVEMDAFREEIPSIFHNDSSLRLQPFDEEQARRAISLPAREVGGEIEDELVDAITRDLAERGRIEPARLQIVCDTLWHEADDMPVGMWLYRRLGGATRILERRLAEDIRGLEDRQLALFERLLPQLRTEFKTKYTRGVDELVDRLGADPSSLGDLVETLTTLRLLRRTAINRALYVEWTSDYLAARTDDLQQLVRATTLGRLLAAAVRHAGAAVGAPDAEAALSLLQTGPEEATPSPALPSAEDLDSLSEGAALLGGLDRSEARLLLVASLAHGAHMRRWFDLAAKRRAGVWRLLQALLTRPGLDENAVRNAVRLLGEVRSRAAMGLLEVAVGQPMSAPTALRVLEEMHTGPAVALLTKVARTTDLASEAIDALRRMGKKEAVEALASIARTGDATALRAGSALSLLAGGPDDRAITAPAKAALANVLRTQARTLFLVALRHGLEVRSWFERAQAHGVDVWKLLRDSVTRDDVPIDQARGALRLLFELPDQRAEELIELASGKDRLAETAGRARSTRESLETIRTEPSPPATLPASAVDPLEWQILLDRTRDGRLVPVLGPDPSHGPSLREIAEKWSFKYELPASDPGDLALVSQLFAARTDRQYVALELAGELRRERRPEGVGTSDIHGRLADLPLRTYLTTSYDTSMEEALIARGRSPLVVSLPSTLRERRGSDVKSMTGTTEPVVVNLLGSVDAPDSLVLSEDDYLELLIGLASERSGIARTVRQTMTPVTLLLLGLHPRGWPFRVFRHGLLGQLSPHSGRRLMAVLPPPGQPSPGPSASEPFEDQIRDLQQLGVKVYAADPGAFVEELHQRWQALVPS